MIVCSCNVISDSQVKSLVANAKPCARIRNVYASLGCVAKCGRCARTIRAVLENYEFATEAANVA
jgi:bacterioferritin-associated ferredoxin